MRIVGERLRWSDEGKIDYGRKRKLFSFNNSFQIPDFSRTIGIVHGQYAQQILGRRDENVLAEAQAYGIFSFCSKMKTNQVLVTTIYNLNFGKFKFRSKLQVEV